MTAAILVILCIFLILSDAIPVIKGKHTGEVILYSILFIASFTVLFAKSLGMGFPNISEPLQTFIEAVFKIA